MGFVLNYLRNVPSVALGRQPRHPLLISYYVTHRCPYSCRYCSDGDGRRFREDPVAELPLADIRRLLAILRRACDTLDITGGEPMTRPDLEEILACARKLGFRTVLNTKGVGLPERPDLMKLTDVLVLGVDSVKADEIAALMGQPVSTGQEVLRAVDFAEEQRGRTGTRVVLSTVATSVNLASAGNVMACAVKRGFGFHLSPQIVGVKPDPLLRGNSEYADLIDNVVRTKRRTRGILGCERYLRGIRDFTSFHCHPMLMPVIRPDGRMYYPCLESKQAEVSVLAAGGYYAALKQARRLRGGPPICRDCCHIFCHMALSLLQRHPLAALAEQIHWSV
jgi:MoaA/NifB/PqqE/SkfB family radical SAM enzyme